MAQTTTTTKEKEPKPHKTGGDDLDDGLELDPDLLAASDDEEDALDDATDDDGEGSSSPKPLMKNNDGRLPALEGEEDEILASPIAEGKKRKADEVDDIDDDEDEDEGRAEATSGVGASERLGEEDDGEARQAEKKRRKKEKEKERKARKLQKATDPSDSNTPPTHLPPADISAVLLRSVRESYPSASSVELDDIIIPTTNLLPPPEYSPPKEEQAAEAAGESGNESTKTSPSFVGLQKRVEHLLKVTEKKKLHVATPRIIILSLSGLRCADVVRGVRDVKGQGEVAKLFAKHFKLADQIKYLEKTKVSIAVGTPARVGKLLNEGAIKITSDTVLLLDVSHQDSKTRTILTLPEVRDELWKTVFAGKARETLLNGGARIGVF
ncbi:hypothetical protein IAU59_000742 [Kwoniella sp. CBS 9459]